MKGMRLHNYKDIVLSRDKYKSREEIENIVRAVYQSIPSTYVYTKEGKQPVRLYKYTIKEDAELTIRNLTSQIWLDSEKINGEWVPVSMNPYKSFSELARSSARSGNIGTKEELWKLFRTNAATSQIYMRFNSYMYRNGYSAKGYWMQNVDIDTDHNITTATCELPSLDKLKPLKVTRYKKEKVRFELLKIIFDRSSGELTARLTL